MGQRHGDKADIVGGPAIAIDPSLASADPGFEQVAVGQHDALGPAGRARGVELQRRVGRADGGRGVAFRRGVAPRRIAVRRSALQLDRADRAARKRDRLLGEFAELPPDEQQRNLAILQQIGDFCGGKPPADRQGYRAGLRPADQDLEEAVRVLGEVADSAPLRDPFSLQRIRDAAGVGVQLTVGRRAALEDQGDGVGPKAGIHARDVAKCPDSVERVRAFSPHR